MQTPLEKKFNEYISRIHSILNGDKNFLNEPAFINELLDRTELLKRNFIMMTADPEDVYLYQDSLDKLVQQTSAALDWIENYKSISVNSAESISSLKETIFMLNDMFQTSKNLIKSIYPVS